MTKRIKFKKISWKLTVAYAALFSIVLLILSAGIILGIRYYLVQQSAEQVKSSTEVTSKAIQDALRENNALKDPELLSEADANPEISIKITGSDGSIIQKSDKIDISGVKADTNFGTVQKIEYSELHLMSV